MTVREAVSVILSDTKSYTGSLNYAVNYFKYALVCPEDELKVQCLYILNNITHWRHPQAKDVRKVLKDYVK